MSDNITLPREVAKLALDHIEWYIENERGGRFAEVREAAEALRTALAAPCLEVTVDPRLTPDEAAAISSALAAPRQKPEPVAYFDLQKQVFFWAKPTMIDVPMTVALNPLPLYTAPPAAAPEPVRHPGYLIGNHWLETAYSRVCAGEAEADVLRDCGWERVDEALRRDAERYRWLRGEHSRIDPCIKANAKYKLERQSSTWVEIHDLDAAIDAAMGDKA